MAALECAVRGFPKLGVPSRGRVLHKVLFWGPLLNPYLQHIGIKRRHLLQRW